MAFKENGKLKLLIIVGTRPEIIRLAAVINKCREYFDTLLVHTGQNYDYTLNGVFFKDLGIKDPDIYLDAVGKDLGETMGNIIANNIDDSTICFFRQTFIFTSITRFHMEDWDMEALCSDDTQT